MGTYVIILSTHKSEVNYVGNKKMGRPTDNPKDISLKVLLDRDTADKLAECAKALEVSKAEVMRRGVNAIHRDLPK